MSNRPVPTTPALRAQQRAADAQYYRDVLNELAELGGRLARSMRGQEHTESFRRLTRSIRLNIMMAHQFTEPEPALQPVFRDATRRLIRRRTESRIDEAASGSRAESLKADLLERMDGPDIDAGIGTRPIGEIIEELCRDLGVAKGSRVPPGKCRPPSD